VKLPPGTIGHCWTPGTPSIHLMMILARLSRYEGHLLHVFLQNTMPMESGPFLRSSDLIVDCDLDCVTPARDVSVADTWKSTYQFASINGPGN